jgi:hypothetical protein
MIYIVPYWATTVLTPHEIPANISSGQSGYRVSVQSRTDSNLIVVAVPLWACKGSPDAVQLIMHQIYSMIVRPLAATTKWLQESTTVLTTSTCDQHALNQYTVVPAMRRHQIQPSGKSTRHISETILTINIELSFRWWATCYVGTTTGMSQCHRDNCIHFKCTSSWQKV